MIKITVSFLKSVMGLHSLLFKTTFGLHRSNSPFYTAFILPCNLGVIRGTSKVEKKHTKNCPFRKYPYICTAIERCFMYFLIRRDGRVVDYSGLENRRTERYRGFESLSLRQKVSKGFHNPLQNSLQNIDNRCKIKVLQRFFFVYTPIY